jgi:hypothetical protein
MRTKASSLPRRISRDGPPDSTVRANTVSYSLPTTHLAVAHTVVGGRPAALLSRSVPRTAAPARSQGSSYAEARPCAAGRIARSARIGQHFDRACASVPLPGPRSGPREGQGKAGLGARPDPSLDSHHAVPLLSTGSVLLPDVGHSPPSLSFSLGPAGSPSHPGTGAPVAGCLKSAPGRPPDRVDLRSTPSLSGRCVRGRVSRPLSRGLLSPLAH